MPTETRLSALERKLARVSSTLDDLCGNIIEYRTDLSMVRQRLKEHENMLSKLSKEGK